MYLLNLISVAFIASIGLVEAETPKELQSDSPKIELQLENDIGLPGSKVLRSTSAARIGVTEERAGGLSVPPLEKIKSVLTSSRVTTKKLESWLQSKKSADIVFARLHLGEGGNPFFRPQFDDWIKYADDLSAKVPEMSAISTLTRQYGDDRLFRMIKVAKTKTDTRSLATKLETEQMQHWVTTRRDPDEVFQLFELNFVRENIFKRPEFTTWAKYVDDLNIRHPEEPTWMYSTLTKYLSDKVLFKLTADMKWSEKTKDFAIKLEDDWLQAGLQSQKTPENVLVGLGLGKTTDSLFESPLFSHWSKYTAAFNKRYPEEKATMIETLAKHFGDIEVTKMLHTAKSKEWTKPLAAELESAQIKMWLDSGKSSDDVFKLLKLDQEANIYSFRDKVLLSTWVSYLNFFTTKYPDKKAALFAALEARLNDIPLNEVLNMAKQFSSLENAAIKIQTNKIRSYLVSNEPPGKVFTMLRLADEGDGILGTPLFQKWMKYVEDFNKRNPTQKVSWFNPIRIECEWGGIRMIDKAMQNPSTVDIGKKVEREWLNYWLDNDKPPEVVFRWLDLVNGGGYALADRKFKTWTTYLGEFNRRYPTKTTTVIDGLRNNYNDIKLLRVFKEAKNNPTTEKLTVNLENDLIDKWVAEKKSVEFLQKQLGHVDTSKDMIQRYTARLEKLRNHTS